MRKLVRVLKTFEYSDDGIAIRTASVDTIVGIKSDLFDGLSRAGYVSEIDVSAPASVEPPPAPVVQTAPSIKRNSVRGRRFAPRPAVDAPQKAVSASVDDAPTSEDAEG